MKRVRLLSILFLTLIFFTTTFAKISVTYSGFSGFAGNYKTIFDSYIEEYGVNSTNLFGSMANCFAITNVTQPVFGEGYRNLAVGVTGGIGITVPPDTGAGAEGLGNAGFGATAAPFVTISLDPLYSVLGLGLFEDTDLTFKILPLTIKPTISGNKWTFKFFNMGIILRKRIISPSTLIPVLLSFEGISISFGTFYSSNDIKGAVSINKTETFEYNESGLSGTVSGTIHSLDLQVKTKSFSFDTEIKGYLNLLYVLDLFAGFGVSYNPANRVEVNGSILASAEVNITTPIPGSDNDSGSIIINGEDDGKRFIPRLVGGLQLNLGPVKIPFQGTLLLGTENKSYALTFGVTVSF